MSILIMTEVWAEAQVKPHELLVLLCLADHADDYGDSCYPSIARLAKRTRRLEPHRSAGKPPENKLTSLILPSH